MTAHDDELQALAGEYVLGLLTGEERDRVERRMTGDARLRRHVEAWQLRLQPLAEAVEPVTPSAEAWQRIETTLGSPAALRQRRPLASDLRGPRWWERIGFWRAWAGVATLAATALAAWIVTAMPLLRPAPAAPRLVALLSSVGGEPFWLVSAASPGRVAVRPVQDITRTAQAHVLWVLPGGGQPVFVGVLDTAAETRRDLPPEAAAQIQAGAALAVTLEPAGSTPGTAPTGPVTYRGRLVQDAP